MEIEFSRGVLGWIVVIGVFVALALVGRAVTPADGSGGVLVLSPSYVATVRYLKIAQRWLEQMENVEGKIKNVLEGQGNFYRQGQEAESAFESAASIARSIRQRQPPLALLSLQSAVDDTANLYVEAARRTLAYVSEPSDENKAAAFAALEKAGQKRLASETLQEGMWPTR